MSLHDDIDLSPAEPPFRARRLEELLDHWLEDCHRRLDHRRDDGTLDTFTSDVYADKVAYFRRWWAQIGPTVEWELRREDMLKFRTWLGEATESIRAFA